MRVFYIMALGLLGLGAATAPAHAQAVNYNKVAIVRAYEQAGNNNLIIHYGDNEFVSMKLEGRVGRKDQEIVAGQLQEMVEKFYNQGYEMLGMTSAGLPSGTVTTFVFRQRDRPAAPVAHAPAPAVPAAAPPAATAVPPAPPTPAATAVPVVEGAAPVIAP